MSLPDVLAGRARWAVECGDALAVLPTLPDACVEAVVTDPPAGISFMDREWDRDRGGRDAWIAWLASVMRECLRVLKPGGHALVWALPRTSHWTATACEDAGFEIRDRIAHLFGSGFPKSLSVGKAIDKAAGAEREVVGPHPSPASATAVRRAMGAGWQEAPMLTAPATDDAKKWAGFGTALKPAVEDWWLCRKPLGDTVAGCVLAHGTGGLNIDGCRFRKEPDDVSGWSKSGSHASENRAMSGGNSERAPKPDAPGRWPANLVLSHAPGCVRVGTRKVKSGATGTGGGFRTDLVGGETKDTEESRTAWGTYNGPDGTETVEAWDCAPGCPVAELDRQSGELVANPHPRHNAAHPATVAKGAGYEHIGHGHADTGGASRFFYCAKPSRAEREDGCAALPARTGADACDREEGSAGLDSPRAGAGRTAAGVRNFHPTVKSDDLMRWLVRLVTPPDGIILDPFAGSGSTGRAALLEGFRFLGIDRDPEYVAIANARIAAAAATGHQASLFGDSP